MIRGKCILLSANIAVSVVLKVSNAIAFLFCFYFSSLIYKNIKNTFFLEKLKRIIRELLFFDQIIIPLINLNTFFINFINCQILTNAWMSYFYGKVLLRSQIGKQVLIFCSDEFSWKRWRLLKTFSLFIIL